MVMLKPKTECHHGYPFGLFTPCPQCRSEREQYLEDVLRQQAEMRKPQPCRCPGFCVHHTLLG